MALFSELRRRNVLKVALLYALASLLIFWLVGGALVWLGAPSWANEFLLLVIAISFPVALIFAWFYEITPKGLKRSLDVDQTQSIVYKTGQKLNAAVSVLAVLGVLALVGERLLPTFELPKIIEPILLSPVYEAPDQAGVPVDIRAHTLDNGLRIIVWPDHDIPNVVMYNFVRAGGRNEYPGITGLSHFFEHMMFNGTKKRKRGEFDETMEAAGGSNNAYTSDDLTVYTNWFPKSALETIFDLEGDRLANLKIDPEVVEDERNIVYSERRSRYDNDNFGRLYLEMKAVAYIAHPYQFPVIGWTSDIERWTQEDLESYFATYYAPNNQTMIFSGDVDAEELFEMADDYFGSMEAQEPPQAVRTIEPKQLGERRLLVEVDAPTPLLHVAFHAGDATDPKTLPMSMLLNILTGGSSSRLHQLFVEQEQIALDVNAFQSEGLDPGLVYFYLTLPPGADAAAVEDRLLQELARVSLDGVTDAELAKARNIMVADYWRELSTIDGKASALGRAELFMGNYQLAFSLPEQFAAVAAEEVQAVAAEVFIRTNMTVGVLRSPLPEAER